MGWGRIKISLADKLFSEFVRRRSGGKCARCMRDLGWKRLQNSHFFGRRFRSLRFNPDNCDALCSGCHRILGENPNEFNDWKKKRLGEDKFNMLRVLAYKGTPVKKKDEKMIVIWCREQLKTMEP